MVQSGAETDARRAYADLVNVLQQHAASTAAGSNTSRTDAGHVRTQEVLAAGAEEPVKQRRKPISSNQVLASGASVWICVSLAASVLVLAWAVLLAGHNINSELRALHETVKQCNAPNSARLFPFVT